MTPASSNSDDVLDLKRRAVELKRAGDIEGARSLLAKARDLEFDGNADEAIDKCGDDAAALKRLAVVLKRRGDLGGARNALLKAKELEGDGSAAATTTAAPASTSGGGDAGGGAVGGERKQARQQREQPGAKEQRPPPAAEAGSPPPKRPASPSLAEPTESDESVTFTDEEMLDLSLMSELKSGGMDVPSESDYQSRTLAAKKQALKCRDGGDMDGARKFLAKVRALETACAKLHAEADEEEEAEEVLGEEDERMLAELMGGGDDDDDPTMDGSAFLLFEEDSTLDLDDLDTLDAAMLKDMIDAGMEIPTPEEILEQSDAKKNLAVGLKKDGNMVGAKAALLESKRLKGKAEQLAQMLAEIETLKHGDEGGDEDWEEDMLEEMLLGAKKKEQKAPQAPPLPTKTVAELKLEAMQYKSEGKLAEAAAALRQVKAMMEVERQAKEVEKRRELSRQIREEEMAVSDAQVRLFAFYERFVDAQRGGEQRALWEGYTRDCLAAADAIEKGERSTDITRGARRENVAFLMIETKGEKDDLSFVGEAADPSDERMEVALLGVSGVSDNRAFKKIIKEEKKRAARAAKDDPNKGEKTADLTPNIRVDVTIQLPPNQIDTDESIRLVFRPANGATDNVNGFNCKSFGPSQYASLPRGKSKYARMIRSRMGRKKLTFSVYHDPPPPEKPKGWFASFTAPVEEERKATLLGTVTFELKEFLRGNCVAGDFLLMDSFGRNNPAGGTLRLGVRTGASYEGGDPEGGGVVPVDMRPYQAMIFS